MANLDAIENLLIDLFLEAHDTPPTEIILDMDPTDSTPPTEIILDMDPTDSPVHGEQWGRHFQGHWIRLNLALGRPGEQTTSLLW